jgi:hypothetical protein
MAEKHLPEGQFLCVSWIGMRCMKSLTKAVCRTRQADAWTVEFHFVTTDALSEISSPIGMTSCTGTAGETQSTACTPQIISLSSLDGFVRLLAKAHAYLESIKIQ